MASTRELFIPTPDRNPTTVSCKAISLVLSIASLVSLAAIITLERSPTNHINQLRATDLCIQSSDPLSCRTIVAAAITAPKQSQIFGPSPIQTLQTLIDQSVDQLDTAAVVTSAISTTIASNKAALADCVHLLDLSRDRLLESADAIAAGAHTDARTWLSAVLTNYDTCMDGLNKPSSSPVKAHLDSLSKLASASLAVLTAIAPNDHDAYLKQHVERFPSWVMARDRKLLEASRGTGVEIEANVTVASDGSGKFVTVQDAVNSAPDKGKNRYVIYVKKGRYAENVMVNKNKTNVMIVGDGMSSTVITGSLYYIYGTTSTFDSATLAAAGDGFILQDICIENTAGAAKEQAVALRINADRAVVHRCQINAYQDTLYPHSLRQFYRDSSISGTIDFIFGNAAVVFQNCTIIARLPMPQQKNVVTAQGRIDPLQNTGTSIQNCRVIPSPDLVPMIASIPTYLGRPWKNYSTTVYMQSYIGSHINPKGWLEWDGNFPPDTLYYGEFANVGPGAGVVGRVTWKGYHVITDPNEANKFTVANLIQGDSWLQSTGVEFTNGL